MSRPQIPLTIHPEPPHLEPLIEYIAGMPGGKYIGKKWLKEPFVLCAVNAEEVRYALDVTALAYPPRRCTADTDIYMFAIPALVAHVLVWHADEFVHSAVTAPLPAWCDDADHVVAILANQLQDIYELETWGEALTHLGTHAAAAGLCWKDVLNVVARLYADDPRAHELDELIEPAIAALRSK